MEAQIVDSTAAIVTPTASVIDSDSEETDIEETDGEKVADDLVEEDSEIFAPEAGETANETAEPNEEERIRRRERDRV